MRILFYEAENPMFGMRYPFKNILEKLGHQVDIFDWSYYFSAKGSKGVERRIFDKLFFSLIQKKINEDLIMAAKGGEYELIFIMMGKYIYPETLIKIKENNGLLINWNTDYIYNAKSSSSNVIESIPVYDLIFSPRLHLLDEFVRAGAQRVLPIDWYPHPGLLRAGKVELGQPEICDVSFVGSWSWRREELLTAVHPNQLHIYGWGWNKHASSSFHEAASSCNISIPIAAMGAVFEQTKINVNILTQENRDTTNLRNFEIPASSAFQLAERSDRLLELFDEDKEIVCFSSPEELKSKCNFYLRNDALRNRIARAGYDRLISSSYTLEARLRLIMKYAEEFL